MESEGATPRREWTICQIRELVEAKFQKRPCWFQIQVALALHKGKDVVACAPTGAGKTLSFWIPLLMARAEGLDKMTIVVTPLNLLRQQNVDALAKAGLRAVSVTQKNASSATFKDIEEGKYEVVVINPEILLNRPEMLNMFKKPKFTNRILNIIFDEGHCIIQWGTFRKKYRAVGSLRYLISERIPFYVPSATLPTDILAEICEVLRLRPSNTEYILRSNDRPDIHLAVHPLVYPANSFKDLGFLIPEKYKAGVLDSSRPPKFVVFFDNTRESQDACEFLRTRLADSLQDKVKYFHATMSQMYCEEETADFASSDIWGMCCTDAFGMGVDISDIDIVVQYKATCNLCTLWQRFGRVARGSVREGTAILLVEKKDTDDGRSAKISAQERKTTNANRKRKANRELHPSTSKKPALEDRSTNVLLAATDEDEEDDDHEEINELEEWKKERRLQYFRTVKEKDPWKKGKGKEVEVGSAMDDYINPHQSAKCHRVIPMMYFGNDKLERYNDHVQCDTTSPTGCQRCKPQVSRLCCDLCNPTSFSAFNVVLEMPPKGISKTPIKPYVVQPAHEKFEESILQWRHEKALTKFGASAVHRFGPRMLMSDKQVTHLIDCAQAQKILTVEQLGRELGWRTEWAEELGQLVVELVAEHFPPLQVVEVPADKTRKRAPQKCGACGLPGHNRTNAICTKKNEEHM